MKNDTRKSDMIYVIFWGTLFFVFSYYIFTELTKGVITKDFPSHMEGAEMILNGELLTFLKADSYPLWQIFVALAALFRMPVAAATALVCSPLHVADFILIIRFLDHYEFRSKTIAPLTCALLLLGPMYLPWYNPNIYLGQGTPNVWHNPTTICVRPFALATFLLIINILKKGEEQKECGRKEFVVLAVMLVCCNLAKPSFMQGADTRTRSVLCIKIDLAAREESDVLSESGGGLCSVRTAPWRSVGHFFPEFAICRGRDSHFAV